MEFVRCDDTMKVRAFRIRSGIRHPEACLVLYGSVDMSATGTLTVEDVVEGIRMLRDADGVEFSIHPSMLPECAAASNWRWTAERCSEAWRPRPPHGNPYIM